MNVLEGGNLTILRKSLDALWLRQKVISNNLANNDTPGFKSSTVLFEEFLKDALNGASLDKEDVQKKLDSLQPAVITNQTTASKADGNNVDVDAENMEFVRTQIEYEYLTRMLSSEISRMKYIVTEGKG